jgi:hypothetical protein
METILPVERETLKRELLSVVAAFNQSEADAIHPPELAGLIEALIPLSPIPDPINYLPLMAGSWTSLYAKFGVGHSKGKSHRDDSTLSLHSFRAFPDAPIRVSEILQEIGVAPNAYNNVVLFETIEGAIPGLIIIHGDYERDMADPKRFRVVFRRAEIQPRNGAAEADLREALRLPADATLTRAFKPARLYSDVVYLDGSIRINIGGMGGVYVLERRLGSAISI